MSPRNSPEDVWRLVTIGGPDECWLWRGTIRHHGYGCMRVSGRKYVAHRLAFQVATGTDPGEFLVCHSCDNRLCCNPAHLFLGTPHDNTRDMWNKGRAKWLVGSAKHCAKVTEEQVRVIRRRLAVGEAQKDLALEFGINRRSISAINTRRYWKHV